MQGMIDGVGPVRVARPRRVAALAGLLAFGGTAALVLAAAGGAGPYGDLAAWASALIGAASLCLAWAVWRAHRWAWWTLVAMHGTDGAVRLLLAQSAEDTTSASLGLLWPALYLVLLVSERTRAWFGIGSGRDAPGS
jgi:hypothetical protein